MKCCWCGSFSKIMTQNIRAKWQKKWFSWKNSINVMEWPTQSPDLNSIENLCAIMKEKVSANKPNSVGDLWKAVQKIWGSITVERCQYLVISMGRCCLAVIANKRHATKYWKAISICCYYFDRSCKYKKKYQYSLNENFASNWIFSFVSSEHCRL